jgi:hypothetical protein
MSLFCFLLSKNLFRWMIPRDTMHLAFSPHINCAIKYCTIFYIKVTSTRTVLQNVSLFLNVLNIEYASKSYRNCINNIKIFLFSTIDA